MGSVKERIANREAGKPHRPGGAPLTTPSVGKGARNLDPDLNPWDRHPGESKAAYDAFLAFRDDDARRVGSKSNLNWSGQWSWGFRAFEWDRFLARQDQDELVRYRRRMNDRQRKIASAAQQKVIQWLAAQDVRKWTAGEAARWLEVAVKIERLAGGAESERVAVAAQGRIEDLTPEEVSEALQALTAEIHRATGIK